MKISYNDGYGAHIKKIFTNRLNLILSHISDVPMLFLNMLNIAAK